MKTKQISSLIASSLLVSSAAFNDAANRFSPWLDGSAGEPWFELF